MKKKILIFITIFMLILSINYEVKADGEAPSSAGYKVVVKNKNGTPLYEDGKKVTTIPYKGVAYVVYEGYDDNNKKILYVTYKTYDAGLQSYYVKAEDVLPKDYNLKDANKLDEKKEAIVFNKNGGILREGPSDVYEELPKKIPTGTTITYQYIDNGYGLWAYVEYEDVKGWLYIYSYAKDSSMEPGYVVDKRNSSLELLSINTGAKLYNSIYMEENDIAGTIDTHTKLDCKYEYINCCYVEYKGQYGWVPFYDENFVIKDTNKYYEAQRIVATNDTYLYKDSNFKNKSNIKISKNTILNEIYFEDYHDEPGFYGAYYVKYKNQYGWLDVEHPSWETCEVNIDDKSPKKFDRDLNIYEIPDVESKIISSIPNGTTFNVKCNTEIYKSDNYYDWIYVDYDGSIGWVSEEAQYGFNDNETENEEDDREPENKPSDKAEETKSSWFKSLTPIQFALLCIGAAVVLAVTSIVIILLIKKNNNKKAKESKKDSDTAKTEEQVNKTKEQEKSTSDETTELEEKQNTNKEESTDKK